MSSLISLQRQQKTILNSISNLYITLDFLFTWNWNNKYVYTLLWFPRKSHPIPDENEQSWYSFSDWNGTKTIHTLWGSTTVYGLHKLSPGVKILPHQNCTLFESSVAFILHFETYATFRCSVESTRLSPMWHGFESRIHFAMRFTPAGISRLMIFCLIFFLVPESVREPNVDSADSDKVTINWQPPETDAGITKYKVRHSIQPIIEHCHATRAKRGKRVRTIWRMHSRQVLILIPFGLESVAWFFSGQWQSGNKQSNSIAKYFRYLTNNNNFY